MADSVTVTNMPDSGSHEAVALQLMRISVGYTNVTTKDELLDRYVECLSATWGQRPSR